jgi:ABC-type nitrate/sulfonate/bicarbonate transport system substrate-binding protein
MKTSTLVIAATLAALSIPSADAADLVKVAIGQRGLWDSAIVEGCFRQARLAAEIVYTAGGGETQQAVISGSVDIGVGRHDPGLHELRFKAIFLHETESRCGAARAAARSSPPCAGPRP